ncbi:MAG: 30S ribosomal protein S8 [candidate division Zixibacteria bacterium DG_27]|nr:MAG: 30S ribosomal protein S8 [candidate division Zixibacteria bacterium DG_27]
MTMTDPIADMLTRLRNAYRAKHKEVEIPASKIKRRIAEILLEGNYISKLEFADDNKQGILRLYLSYTASGESAISGLKRLSRPGLRVYYDKDQIRKMTRHLGMLIVSSSSGVMTDAEARRRGIGGELLCRVW